MNAVHCFHLGSLIATAGLDCPGFGPAFPVEEVRRSDRADFERAMKALDWRGAAHEASFLDGEPAERILGLSRSADLIAMGTHGRTGLASVVLGSVACSVLKRPEKPVLAIRHPERRFLT